MFHVLTEINLAILRAVAPIDSAQGEVRKPQTAALPKLPRGRPKRGRPNHRARRNQKQRHRVAELFEHRQP